MIRVATCGDVRLADGDVADVLARCCAELQLEDVAVAHYASALDLIEEIVSPSATSEEPIDLVLCAMELPGMSGLQVAGEITKFEAKPQFALFAPSREYAFDASRIGVECYFAMPLQTADFERQIKPRLVAIDRAHENSVVLRFREGLRRVSLMDFMYAETANHDQIIHLPKRKTYSLRCSSQGLYDMVADKGCFFKAGSSSIINLYGVRAVRSAGGSILFADGSIVTVPIRHRKQLEQALFAVDAQRQVAVGRRGE